jgi:hypothetical protein
MIWRIGLVKEKKGCFVYRKVSLRQTELTMGGGMIPGKESFDAKTEESFATCVNAAESACKARIESFLRAESTALRTAKTGFFFTTGAFLRVSVLNVEESAAVCAHNLPPHKLIQTRNKYFIMCVCKNILRKLIWERNCSFECKM